MKDFCCVNGTACVIPLKKHALSISVWCVLAAVSPVMAQVDDRTPAPGAADLDRVVVTGIRGSLQSSMNLKRDSAGVVDGIIAEDIGKFPDTNLAESLQRISGVSIDRTASGEGSRVTIRGVGPDFNLVLLNGRQMPVSNFGGDGFSGFSSDISDSRAFDFANLASEAVAELQVYKTTRADTPTGGIGGTINVKTARALDNPGLHASVGVKGVMDQSVDNLPRSFRGKSITPEVSGIFSNTFADGRFGISANASYQARDSGTSDVAVSGGWVDFRGDDGDSWNRIPLKSEPEYIEGEITNRPGPNDIYARPQDIAYNVRAVQRQRRNAQMALQFAPTDTLTATLDYTYADHRVQQQRNELSVYFQHTPGVSAWTDGPIAMPILYSERVPTGNVDYVMSGGDAATRSELKSLGFNIEWQVNDDLDLALDYHDSKSESRPDSPFGANNVLGAAVLGRRDFYVDFSTPLPVLNVQLAPGMTADPEFVQLTGSFFANKYNRSEVKQWQGSGTFRFADYQQLDFGAGFSDVYNRTAVGSMPVDEWGGIGTPDDYDDSIWYTDNIGRYFSRFAGHDDPRFTDQFAVMDFQRLIDRAIAVTGCAECYRMPDTFDTDLNTTEKTRSAYVQWRNTFDWMVPVNVAAGMRYEKTEVNSPSRILPPVGNVNWISMNEMSFELGDTPEITNHAGSYDYWLPSVDVRVELQDNLLLRSSYSKSLGRAGWRAIQGGLTVRNQMQIGSGGDGYRGNPALLPLESKNFDLSVEWYYAEGSYISAGYFRKNIKNFISETPVTENPFPGLNTPRGGAYWNQAINAGGCGQTDMVCIRDYIFLNLAGQPGVNHTGQNASGQQTGTITGQPGDPLAAFDVITPINQRSDTLDGLEISVQHMFGSSGFGVAANYTKVSSGLKFDNTSLDEQYPMLGLSDSANLVLFYEKYDWQIRAAYNWRDEFLSSIGGFAEPRMPNYTESYGQLDMNVTWAMHPSLSLFIEGINLTDETMRIHGRHRGMLRFASQTGRRYMFGLRYKF